VRLAARGARETPDGGMAPIEDPEEVRQLKRQAGRVYRESTAIAVLTTGVVMLARGIFGS
jgi:hypothetical protein